MTKSKSYRRMTRADLRDFDDQAIRLILEAMNQGALGRLSSRGHVILRSPSGATCSVPAHMGDNVRTFQNVRAALRRAFPRGEF